MKTNIEFIVNEEDVEFFNAEIRTLEYGKVVELVLSEITIHKLLEIVKAGNHPKIKILSKWMHPTRNEITDSDIEEDVYATIIDGDYAEHDKNCIDFIIEGSTEKDCESIYQMTEDGLLGDGDVFTVGLYPYLDYDIEDKEKHLPYDFEILSI